MHIPRSHHHNLRALPALIDRHADQLQAAEDDAALARDDRNEAIADSVTFDVLPFSTEQIAVLDAALRRGQIEDVYEVWNVCKTALDDEIARRIKKLSDESFEQFIQMLRNFRKIGFLHSMDFARAKWGTKWNACDSSADIEAGTAEFDTAWSCPVPIFEALSRRFPEDVITVTYADEDIGSNCGTFSMRNGAQISSEIAPAWRDMTAEQRAKWRAFACEVTGRDPKDYEDEEA